MKIKYIDPGSITVLKWNGTDNPKDYLILGKEYEIDHLDIRSTHTKVYLKDFPKQKFNSVHFYIDNEYFQKCINESFE